MVIHDEVSQRTQAMMEQMKYKGSATNIKKITIVNVIGNLAESHLTIME